mgnify:CR=1 FL=1|jgi:flagellar motor switch protein FliN
MTEYVNKDILEDLNLDVSATFNSIPISLDSALAINEGSIIEVSDSDADAIDMNVFVNGELIAKGEIVVVGNQYGIRLTEFIINNIN